MANMAYLLSQQGTIGRKQKALSDAANQLVQTEGGQAALERGVRMNHVYKVVDRTEKDGDVVVRFEYVGQEDRPR